MKCKCIIMYYIIFFIAPCECKVTKVQCSSLCVHPEQGYPCLSPRLHIATLATCHCSMVSNPFRHRCTWRHWVHSLFDTVGTSVCVLILLCYMSNSFLRMCQWFFCAMSCGCGFTSNYWSGGIWSAWPSPTPMYHSSHLHSHRQILTNQAM